MKTLSLFSGIGGLDLGLERAGFSIVAQCEQEPFCRAVLAKHWPGVPCFEDVRTIDPANVGPVECVCGGFPCQDISVAGKGAGVDAGARSGLWREMLRVIDALRPRWVIAENVPALRTRGADRVLGDLEGIGYACWSFVVGAVHVGAPHRRQRVFVIAYSERNEQRRKESCSREAGRVGRIVQSVPWDKPCQTALAEFRGVDDGIPRCVERTDAIRNAVVPQVAEVVGRAVMRIREEMTA